MPEPGQRRKLAAILSADVVGYSRLMQDDDAATVETLTRYRTIFSDFVSRPVEHEVRVTAEKAASLSQVGQFTGMVSTGGARPADVSASRIPMKVRRTANDCLLCVSVASM